MSNYVILKNNKVAYHPGYYIEEYIESCGLTQEDFAKRLGTTPKNISLLIRGEQKLSTDIAMKLSMLMGTSIKYWLNLQSEYDSLMAINMVQEELEKELQVIKNIDYNYFVNNFNLPKYPRQKDKQVVELRNFLQVSSLTVLRNKDMSVRFRGSLSENEVDTINANIMVQIAANESIKKVDFPSFDKAKFKEAIEYTLTLTKNHDKFAPIIEEKFKEAGVDFMLLPYLSKSRTNGATKKIGKHIMLMLSDRNHYSDSFWFTLFHEIGHIMNGDFGISFENESGEEEDKAKKFAEDSLIPEKKYKAFLEKRDYTPLSIIKFSNEINRDPGIVLGRLEKDKYIKYGDFRYQSLKTKYSISMD